MAADPSSAPARPLRRRRLAGQGRLLGAATLLVLGAFLPWVYTAAGSVSGVVGAGVWTMYAGLLTLAGGLVPRRTAAAVQGAVGALAGVGLGTWQVLHLLGLVGTRGWAPGPGLVLTIGGGVLAGVGAWQLWTGRETGA